MISFTSHNLINFYVFLSFPLRLNISVCRAKLVYRFSNWLTDLPAHYDKMIINLAIKISQIKSFLTELCPREYLENTCIIIKKDVRIINYCILELCKRAFRPKVETAGQLPDVLKSVAVLCRRKRKV